MLFRKEIENSVINLINKNLDLNLFYQKKDPSKLRLKAKIERKKTEILFTHNNQDFILASYIEGVFKFAYPFSTIFDQEHADSLMNFTLQNDKDFYNIYYKNRKALGGESARVSGDVFEQELEKLLNQPGKFRDKVVEELLLSLNLDIKESINWQFNFTQLGKQRFLGHGGKKLQLKQIF